MKPLWKQFFDTVERAAAPVMADATSSEGFTEIMKVGMKISRDMNKQAEAISRKVLHRFNLPSAGDVAYLKNQVGSLEAEVRKLRRALEANGTTSAATTRPRAQKAAVKKPTTKKPPAKKATAKKAATT